MFIINKWNFGGFCSLVAMITIYSAYFLESKKNTAIVGKILENLDILTN